jgi:hypothetical protein
MDISWIERLQVPGLIISGVVIVLLFQLMGKLVAFLFDMQKQRTEERVLLSDMTSMLRQLCQRGEK